MVGALNEISREEVRKFDEKLSLAPSAAHERSHGFVAIFAFLCCLSTSRLFLIP